MEQSTNPDAVPTLCPLPEAERRALAELRILVLYGGPGAEREVSLDSGRQVHDALRRDGRHVRGHDVRGPEDVRALARDADLAVLMLHGEFGEDGEVQKVLDECGLAYTGSPPEAAALAMDKDAAKRRLAAAGIPVAPWGTLRPEGRPGGAESLTAAWRSAGGRFPVMVKPNARGSSVGAKVARSWPDLEEAVGRAFNFDPGGVMVEAYVAGREFTAGWLDGVALPLIELRAAAEFYDYDAKYRSDATRYSCPAPIDPSLAAAWRAMAARVAEILGARDLARVDFMVGDDGPMVLEINTTPGFTTHSLLPKAARAAGLSFTDLAWRLVALAAARR